MDSGNTFFVGLQGGPPWGFRLQGGREYRAPLSVTKVSLFLKLIAILVIPLATQHTLSDIRCFIILSLNPVSSYFNPHFK